MPETFARVCAAAFRDGGGCTSSVVIKCSAKLLPPSPRQHSYLPFLWYLSLNSHCPVHRAPHHAYQSYRRRLGRARKLQRLLGLFSQGVLCLTLRARFGRTSKEIQQASCCEPTPLIRTVRSR